MIQLFREAVSIEEFTSSGTDAFGQTRTTGSWAESSAVRGRLLETGGAEITTAKGAVISTHKLFLPGGTTIDEANRVVISSLTYDVLSVRDPGGMGHHLEVQMRLAA